MISKQTIRQKIKSQRAALSLYQQKQAAHRVWQKIVNQPFFRRAQSIAFYMPVRGELDPTLLRQSAYKMGKKVYLPMIHPTEPKLLFFRHHPQTPLKENRFGILEPKPAPMSFLSPLALDIVFFPLVAFDQKGHRLGMGKGYYDQTFQFARQRTKPLRIGLAYGFQEVQNVPTSIRDIPLHAIFTEKDQYLFAML